MLFDNCVISGLRIYEDFIKYSGMDRLLATRIPDFKKGRLDGGLVTSVFKIAKSRRISSVPDSLPYLEMKQH